MMLAAAVLAGPKNLGGIPKEITAGEI